MLHKPSIDLHRQSAVSAKCVKAGPGFSWKRPPNPRHPQPTGQNAEQPTAGGLQCSFLAAHVCETTDLRSPRRRNWRPRQSRQNPAASPPEPSALLVLFWKQISATPHASGRQDTYNSQPSCHATCRQRPANTNTKQRGYWTGIQIPEF